MPVTHYERLGVARDATPEDLRGAWKRFAREHHPDRSRAPDAAARFAATRAAYDELADPDRRARYDLRLRLVNFDPEAELRRVLHREPTARELRGLKLLRFTSSLWGLLR